VEPTAFKPNNDWGMKTSTLIPLRFVAALAAALLALTASAQMSPSITHGDKSFIEKASKSGQEEVDISQAVVARTTNPDVRAFAQMMIDDHSAANTALVGIASGKGVETPVKGIGETEKWSKKSASDLDKDYVSKMVADHKDAVELFQKEADKGSDLDVKGFARDTLPKLQHHLEMAMDLKKALK
jgi:putative membrane protein